MSSSTIRSSAEMRGRLVDDLRPARVAVLLAQRRELVDDDLRRPRARRRGSRDSGAISFSVSRVLLDDLVALEAGQALEAHLEDGLRLDLARARTRAMRPSRAVAGSAAARMMRDRRGRGSRARSSGPRGCGGAPRPCAARSPSAGRRPRGGARGRRASASLRFRSCGRPSTIASMLTPNDSCSGVCL